MKRVFLAAVFLLVVPQAFAAEAAFVFSLKMASVRYGEAIPRKDAAAILYLSRPCTLPLSVSGNLHGAEYLYGNHLRPACWGRLLGPTSDKVVIFDQVGAQHSDSLIDYAKVEFSKPDEMIAVDRAYSPDQYAKEIKRYHDSLR